jgi:hypothetical protein
MQVLPSSEELTGHEVCQLGEVCVHVCAAATFVHRTLPKHNTPAGHRGIYNKYALPAKPLRMR